jgi:hypothetical protein
MQHRNVGLVYSYRNSNKHENENNDKSFFQKLKNNLPLIAYNFFSPKIYKLNINAIKTIDSDKNIYKLPRRPANKNKYDKDNVIYSIRLIKLLYSFIYNKTDDIVIPEMNIHPIMTYYTKKDNDPIGISILSNDNKTLFFVFRGTNKLDNLIKNLQYKYYTHDETNSLAHCSKGVTEYYNQIIDNIMEEINKYNTINRIFVCGHSLGASLAQIVAYNLSLPSDKDTEKKTYTVEYYGISPVKIGNPPFTNSISLNCAYAISLINLADCIPSMILSYMYDNNQPNTRNVSFTHVQPIAIFNNLKSTIDECHFIDTYHECVLKSDPSIVTNIL